MFFKQKGNKTIIFLPKLIHFQEVLLFLYSMCNDTVKNMV